MEGKGLEDASRNWEGELVLGLFCVRSRACGPPALLLLGGLDLTVLQQQWVRLLPEIILVGLRVRARHIAVAFLRALRLTVRFSLSEFGVHLAELTVDPQGALAIRQVSPG